MGNSVGFLPRLHEVSLIGLQIALIDRTFYADHFGHQIVKATTHNKREINEILKNPIFLSFL